MASKSKRRKTEKLDETETILLGDDLKEIKNILLDFKKINKIEELESKLKKCPRIGVTLMTKINKIEELESKLKKCPRIGVTLMTVLWKCSLQNFNEKPQWLLILNDVLCVLIKIYGTMPSLCSELAEPPGNFANIADPRCMELIAENTHLVDRIAMAIDHDVNEVAKIALQMANLLAVNKNGIKRLKFRIKYVQL
ncbi:hypothetical protein X798_06626 [Onchocerca flexuosa]|uniref:Uncharacterized protein n=1 Tax=Onchocerca flexuosa TaxID=387005 RepID=A0A238BMZ4_9BILA|nr:hypothetical protein X798_06626 [Onchocerca flexuosa]